MVRIDDLLTPVRAWLRVASDPTILMRALVTSVLVGMVLALINHGDRILSGRLGSGDILSISLTFVIPFAVATASSVAATKRSALAGDHSAVHVSSRRPPDRPGETMPSAGDVERR